MRVKQRRANVVGWRKALASPPQPALLLGLCTAHLCGAEGPRKQTHPGLSVFEFRPCILVSSGAAALCAELQPPSKTPIKKLSDSFAGGNALPVAAGKVCPMGWFLASWSQHPLPFRCPPHP